MHRQYTDVLNYCSVYKLLRRLSKYRVYNKMLRIHVFSIFTIKTPRALNHKDMDKCTLTITFCELSINYDNVGLT